MTSKMTSMSFSKPSINGRNYCYSNISLKYEGEQRLGLVICGYIKGKLDLMILVTLLQARFL